MGHTLTKIYNGTYWPLLAVKIVYHHANDRFDWLIFGDQSVNPSRKAISMMSGKYKRFTFVHPVGNTNRTE